MNLNSANYLISLKPGRPYFFEESLSNAGNWKISFKHTFSLFSLSNCKKKSIQLEFSINSKIIIKKKSKRKNGWFILIKALISFIFFVNIIIYLDMVSLLKSYTSITLTCPFETSQRIWQLLCFWKIFIIGKSTGP